ncbi:MAG: hypothetical protein ABIG93_05505 [archaeon]
MGNNLGNQGQPLQDLRNCLQKAKSVPSLDMLVDLENDVVEEAIRNIAEQGKTIHITYNPNVYTQDLKNVQPDSDKVYILCDCDGNLEDLTPLLEFVSINKRHQYQSARKEYLSS